MPTLYRIGCLRDDVIFFIFLYQKWIYPVDKTRTNEFGVTGEQIEQAESKTDNKELTEGESASGSRKKNKKGQKTDSKESSEEAATEEATDKADNEDNDDESKKDK